MAEAAAHDPEAAEVLAGPAADEAVGRPDTYYRFDPTHVAVAVPIVDEALNPGSDSWSAAGRVAGLCAARGLQPDEPLCRELVHALSYELRLADLGRAGCELDSPSSGIYQFHDSGQLGWRDDWLAVRAGRRQVAGGTSRTPPRSRLSLGP